MSTRLHQHVEEHIRTAPNEPGVYIFKNTLGKILYIGKAANLRQRLLSYCRPNELEPAKRRMLKDATKLELHIATSAIDALIMEALEIKKHLPPFNIVLRDDKNYAYVAFTKEDYPRIIVTHQPMLESRKLKVVGRGKRVNSRRRTLPELPSGAAHLLGPYTEAGALRSVLKLLRRVYPYCTCVSHARHKRPCVYSELGQCPMYCCTASEARPKEIREISETERIKMYRSNIRKIKSVLTGGVGKLRKELMVEMARASGARLFERASKLRDEIYALDRIFAHREHVRTDMVTDRAKALRTLKELLKLEKIPKRIEGYDISNFQGAASVGSMVVFVNAEPKKNEYKRFGIKTIIGANDPASIAEVLSRRLKHPEWELPDVILIDGGITQLNAARREVARREQSITVLSIAKKEEKLYRSDALPKKLSDISPMLLRLFQHIRNESHRFAIGYHRKKRTQKLNLT